MKYLGFISCIILSCCMIVSCGRESTKPPLNLVYFNSFESVEDTAGWWGISENMFEKDPAPGGEKQSLHICGGCIQPTAYIDFPPSIEEDSYTVSCWGKLQDLSQTGRIVLATIEGGEKGEAIQLSVKSKKWTFYGSGDFLHCQVNDQLRLEILIGGYAGACMYIDCIKIERVR